MAGVPGEVQDSSVQAERNCGDCKRCLPEFTVAGRSRTKQIGKNKTGREGAGTTTDKCRTDQESEEGSQPCLY